MSWPKYDTVNWIFRAQLERRQKGVNYQVEVIYRDELKKGWVPVGRPCQEEQALYLIKAIEEGHPGIFIYTRMIPQEETNF